MIRILRYQLVFFILMFILHYTGKATENPSRITKMNSGWKFHKGAVEEAYLAAFDDSEWTSVTLPHDWSAGNITEPDGSHLEPFSKESPGGGATGFTLGGEGWYRKKFTTEESSKIYTLLFEGIYRESEIWVNGMQVIYHANGYTPFFCDITDFCLPPGKENCIAVRVLNTGKNSRWYSGSGIYRNVWLIATRKIHFGQWSEYITTTWANTNQAEIALSADVVNASGKTGLARIELEIISPSGEKVASATVLMDSETGKKETFRKKILIDVPELWSVDHPALYNARYTLFLDDEKVDETEIAFGIRTLDFSAEKGFMLNGIPVKLKGGCLHHDNGLLGAAAIDRAEVRKVELLKANGFNAVRCAHNPPSAAFLTACDTLGMLVIDEAFDQWQKGKNPDDYHLFFDRYHEQDLTSMILNDRNHPSIIMWSIGNEIQERADPAGVAIALRLKDIIHRFDTTRPITAAINDFWDNPDKKWTDAEKAFAVLDVAGYNYKWYEYEKDHSAFPGRVIFGSESVPKEASVNWDLVEKYPWIIGDFVWTAMDYLGEAGIGHAFMLEKEEENPFFTGWPWFNAWCGDIDICGNKKPQSYYRDILWDRKPVVMAVHRPATGNRVEKVSYWGWPDEVQCWNWKGYEGKPMAVNVYGKPGEITLYLNNKRIGNKTILRDSNYTATFMVPYEPGILKAVKEASGETFTLESSGEVSGIRLTADRNGISASSDDLAYIQIEAIDAKGNPVTDDSTLVNLKVSGAGILAGAGNASPFDMQSFRSLSPRLFRGRALAIMRPSGVPGEITLRVTAEGFPEAFITITTH
jgi:beta-galactosidase